MVETEEIKKRFKECIGNTVIFCTSVEQLKFLGKMYNGRAFKNLSCNSIDIEVNFDRDDYNWQDSYNFKYFKNKYSSKFKSITFNELMKITNCIEIW
jgi:hypothetical protein